MRLVQLHRPHILNHRHQSLRLAFRHRQFWEMLAPCDKHFVAADWLAFDRLKANAGQQCRVASMALSACAFLRSPCRAGQESEVGLTP